MENEITRLERAIKLIHSYTKDELVGTQLMIFLAVAQKEGMEMQELSAYVEKPQGSLSRNIKKLSIYKDNNGNKAGHDLLDVRPSYNNRRALAVHLSQKGRMLKNELQEMMA